MDYEKAYKESFEAAKGLHDAGNALTKKQMEIVFHKLAESEDERIRRTLAEYFGPEVQLDFVRGVPIQKIRDWLEKQKEQKPVEYLPKEKVYAIMTKLTELSASNLIPINSPEYLKIHQITKDVRSLLDYPIEQKPAEWSEEDRLHYTNVLEALEYVKGCKSDYDKIEAIKSDIAWFKSLRPSWKPSEEQPDVFDTAAFQKGVQEGRRLEREDAKSTIQSRIDEILGDAQPAPILRMELNELIKKIEA